MPIISTYKTFHFRFVLTTKLVSICVISKVFRFVLAVIAIIVIIAIIVLCPFSFPAFFEGMSWYLAKGAILGFVVGTVVVIVVILPIIVFEGNIEG